MAEKVSTFSKAASPVAALKASPVAARKASPVAASPLKTYTITYGDVAENHARMQQIGTLHDNGYPLATLQRVASRLREEGVECEQYDLHDYVSNADLVDPTKEIEPAHLLVIRKGAQHILQSEDTTSLMAENDALDMDKHALMKGRVVNKHARWNLCFADTPQEPDYETGKGRVIPWGEIPLMSKIRHAIAEWTEDTLLNGEANYYYDISKCGIGFHGDGERKKVVAVRMGASMPLYYQWYQRSTAVGPRIKLDLYDGDMYMMSEKAVGFDWMKKTIPTLRHATGCDKFTTP